MLAYTKAPWRRSWSPAYPAGTGDHVDCHRIVTVVSAAYDLGGPVEVAEGRVSGSGVLMLVRSSGGEEVARRREFAAVAGQLSFHATLAE